MSAGTMKRALLELGGNAPFIVFESADMDTSLRAISVAKFRNNGQTCIAANRVFVHASRMSEFCARSQQLMEGMRVGDGREEGVQLGPLINQSALDKVRIYIHTIYTLKSNNPSKRGANSFSLRLRMKFCYFLSNHSRGHISGGEYINKLAPL